jgi:predicted nucleic acid-binding protein
VRSISTSARRTIRPGFSLRPSELIRLPRSLHGTPGVVADLLVDTDVFIDHLRGAARLQPGRHRLHYSVITRAELFAGTTATALATELLAPFRELPVDRSVAERAGRVAREFGLRLPDALIAATALEKGLQLSTRNTKDFKNVRGLRIRAPR